MSHLCTHSYTILRIWESFWWPKKLKVNFKKNAHTDTVLQMLLFIFFHEVLKKQRSSVRGRSFTKNEHDGSQRPDSCHVYPQLKPAEQGWWHSTQGFKCQHPLSHGPTPVGRPPAPRPLLSHPGPHCKQFWLRKALRGERAGGGGDSPRPCHSLHGQVPPESQLSPGVFQGPVSLLCLRPDGGTGAQGRQEHP